ncbi:MAG: bacteriohemerythrin [Gammaproteobacteria bacterium]
MALIDMAAVSQVGYSAIDSDHQEFVSLINQLDSASNGDFPALFKQLFEHTERHFAMENQLMADYDFPAETEHRGEHVRVLGEFKQFQSRVDKGMIAFGRAFIKERLSQWFLLHITTMDSALAAHMRLVGQPA